MKEFFMKKLNVVLSVCAMLILIGFTKQSLAETKKVVTEKKATTYSQGTAFAGKVDSITATELVVSNKAGKKHTFVIDSSTKVMDSADAASTIDHVKAGEKVRVKYSSANGKDEAVKIHLL
jgi:hypothetical protein